ncbi:MAG: UDP-N-acetylmuramoyl-L-alanyl-D-glutamate--2,6-diaminopimelate ligase [Nannocystaceae bacterium]|nr:UDP-N-acetylmuramoyl-L-alanyl-D-glutamate--2,6-diaminopimelate ligase [Nannocystaceae bacterium]
MTTATSLSLGALLRDVPDAILVDCDPATPITGVTADSRRVGAGMLFVALAGGSHDGHAFVPDVIGRGAAAAVVTAQYAAQQPPAGPHVIVRDTWAALPSIAAHAHGDPGESLRLAAVTGTNGKTTTAHLVGAMLRDAGIAHARLGTTGNWLVDHEDRAAFTTPFPLELQALLADTRDRGGRCVVMEASSHALAQARVAPLRFHGVGLTSFSQDHLDFHRDMDEYLQAKCLLARTYLRDDGIAIAAIDDQPAAATFLRAAAEHGARAWSASKRDTAADVVAHEVVFTATGTRARVQTPVGELQLDTPLLGPFNLDNVLVATGLAIALQLPLPTIAAALSRSHGAPGRLEPVAVEGVRGPVVLVDYAHTPDAVERTLAVLRPLVRGRLHVVLGCGGDRDPSKRPRMGSIAARDADVFWATSDNPRTEPPEAIVDAMLAELDDTLRRKVVRESDRARAIARVIADAHDDDLVLIAGKGHEDYQIVGTQKHHFDDREHARDALLLRC